ncbi:MAG TPA: APC family permease [Solirubrobacteraceae bacterium]|nr:APC family permease [Solirubrobacteraceae bacterium]
MSAPEGGRLRRELHFWEAIALSIAIMAPTAAMALNGVGIAGLVGQAVPLAFLFATVGVLFVSYAFAQLTKEVSHAGSVYALTGFTLGARAGFLAGWALLGTYLCFTVASSAEVGLFFSSFLNSSGISDSTEWIWIALVSATLITIVAAGDIRFATRSLLTIEGFSVTLIVILVVVIFVKLIAGDAPAGHSSSLADAFSLPSGTTFDAIATASVFGFLSFAGFEGAASLGEETDNPRRNIPRAVFLAPLSMGIFYFFVMLSQTLGFGTNEAGVAAFAGSSSPLGELSNLYVGAGLEDAINLGATLSAFASALGTATAGSRVLFALSRDSLRPTHPLTRISTRSGAPVGALALVMAIGFGGLIAQSIAGTNAVNAFFYPGTIGVLALMVAYIATNLGAIWHLFLRTLRRPVWQIVFPVVGIAFLVFTIYKNVEGTVAPYSRFPWYVLAWLGVGALIVIAAPHIAKRIGERLTGELEDSER